MRAYDYKYIRISSKLQQTHVLKEKYLYLLRNYYLNGFKIH